MGIFSARLVEKKSLKPFAILEPLRTLSLLSNSLGLSLKDLRLPKASFIVFHAFLQSLLHSRNFSGSRSIVSHSTMYDFITTISKIFLLIFLECSTTLQRAAYCTEEKLNFCIWSICWCWRYNVGYHYHSRRNNS